MRALMCIDVASEILVIVKCVVLASPLKSSKYFIRIIGLFSFCARVRGERAVNGQKRYRTVHSEDKRAAARSVALKDLKRERG